MIKPQKWGFKMAKSSDLDKDNHIKRYFQLFSRLLNEVRPKRGWKNVLIILTVTGFLFLPLSISETLNNTKRDFISEIEEYQKRKGNLVFLQENSLWPISQPFNLESRGVQKIEVVVTAYSSTPWETSGDPYLTAAGTPVRDGIVANNFLPFGTKVRMPEIFGDKIFVVEDRMHWRKSNYNIDIWFPSYWQALNFGVKRTYIEILEG